MRVTDTTESRTAEQHGNIRRTDDEQWSNRILNLSPDGKRIGEINATWQTRNKVRINGQSKREEEFENQDIENNDRHNEKNTMENNGEHKTIMVMMLTLSTTIFMTMTENE